MIFLIVYKNSNTPVVAYEDKEEMIKKLRRLERKEEKFLKKGLIKKKAEYTYKIIKFRRKKKCYTQ